jgi:hypothetical protein
VDHYLAQCVSEVSDARVVSHLETCAGCAARYAAVAESLSDLRDDVDRQVEELFPEDRLQAARRQIARRIENLGHVAKVISFPKTRAERYHERTLSQRGTRWVALAAAAGLLVGIALGAYSSIVTNGPSVDPPLPSSTARASDVFITAPEPETAQRPMIDEEAFLQELEIAGGGLRARPLMPFDAFTPTVREVAAQLR